MFVYFRTVFMALMLLFVIANACSRAKGMFDLSLIYKATV